MTFTKYDQSGAYHWAWADRGSPSYEAAAEARYAVVAKRVARRQLVLDVGCGDGYLMNLLAKSGAYPVGVDPDSTGLSLARRMLGAPSNQRLMRAEANSLPFAAGSFDRVLLVDVIEHLSDPEPCLAEITEVLAPGGQMILTTPKERPGKMWDEAHHVREYSPEVLTTLLSMFFKDVRVSFFLSAGWWEARRRLGKMFMRAWSRHLYNPFLREGNNPERFCHILAVCGTPRPDSGRS